MTAMENDAICTLVTRLARPHASGGEVVERAALLAEGGDFAAVMTWIADHGGEPEATVMSSPAGGLHGSLIHDSGRIEDRSPRRFVLPAGALAAAASPPSAREPAREHGEDISDQ
jgi:hypothetical protein